MPEPTALKELKTFLATIPPGEIIDSSTLAPVLAASWDFLLGSDEGGMESYKLLKRLEQVRWEPPQIKFVIERHGRTVVGSSRADLQHWVVDVEKATAFIEKTGHRQLYRMAKRIYIKPLVEEIVQAILTGKKDWRIERQENGSIVVKTCEIFPSNSAVTMTLEGRRKRFRTALADRLRQIGWNCDRGWGCEVCVPTTTSDRAGGMS
jgi:hypothetical protein